MYISLTALKVTTKFREGHLLAVVKEILNAKTNVAIEIINDFISFIFK